MANSYFLRATNAVTLNVNGKRVTVKHNDIVFGNHDYFISFPGFRHLPGYRPTTKPIDPAPPVPRDPAHSITPNFKELDEMEMAAKKTLEALNLPPVIDMENSTRQPDPKPTTPNLDVLEPLRLLTNKQWFAIDLATAKKALDDAKIDYSHLPEDRWEYIRFLKAVLKQNPK